MPYIGKTPTQGVRQRYMYTATAGQTTFSGTDTQNLTLSYSDSNFIDVYQNGVLLKTGTDYTATSGTSVVLTTGASVDDVVEMIVYDVFASADFFNRTDSDSRYVNIDGDTMTGDLTVQNATPTLKFTDTDNNYDATIQGLSGSLVLTADSGAEFGTETIQFKTGGSQNMTLDASGNFLVGTTEATAYNNSSDVYGFNVYANGQIASSVNGAQAAYFNRQNSDGTIIDLRKDGTSIGDISTNAGYVKINSGNSSFGSGIEFHNLKSIPVGANGAASDGTVSLGDTDRRWNNVYLAGAAYIGGTGSANALDDYEEGTWLPGIEFATAGGTASTATSSYTTGGYTKIGKAVCVEFNISNLSFGNGTGNLKITGLPFTPSGTGAYSGKANASSGHLTSATTAAGYLDIVKLYGTTTGYFFMYSTGNSGAGAWNHITNSNASTISLNSVNGSFTYFTDS